MSGNDETTQSGPLVVAADSDYLLPGVLHFAELLARRERVNAHLVATVPPVDPRYVALEAEDAEALREGRIIRRRRQLRQRLHQSIGRGALFSTGVTVGSSARAVAAVARERRASYILIGLDDPGAPDRPISSRAALQLARVARTAVLAVPRAPTTLPVRALAAVDGTEASVRAAHAAARLLDPGAHLTLAHVTPVSSANRADTEPVRPIRSRLAANSFDRLASELRANYDIRVELIRIEGELVEAVLMRAMEDDIELIACGVSLGAPGKLQLETSVAARLLRDARQAVLLVPSGYRARASGRYVTGRSSTNRPQEES